MPQAIRTRRTDPKPAPTLELVPPLDGAADERVDAGLEHKVAQHEAHAHAKSGWQGMVTKLMVGATLFSALVLPGGATQTPPVDGTLLSARTAQMQVMTQKQASQQVKLPPGTTFRLVAPGPQYVVKADDALSFIVAAHRMQDGSKVSFADVRALNPKIFARDSTGSVLVPGDVVTMPLGAVQMRDPQKLVTRGELADLQTPVVVHADPVNVTVRPIVADPKPVAVVVTPAPVVATPVVVDATPVVVDARPVVVDTRPAVAEHAAFKFPALKAGSQLPAEGVFKTKKLFKTWTIEFTGSAKVVASDAGKLVLHVKATGQNGIFEGKTRTVALEWTQQGTSPEVRFSGREVGDAGDDDVGGRLTVVSTSATESVFKDAKDGKLVRLKIQGDTLSLTYADNAIRFRLSP